MTKFVKIAAVAAALLGTAPAFAATSVTGAAPSATARIIRPLTLTATGSLNFGTIVMNNVTANRTVTVNPDGSITCAVELVCDTTGSFVTYNVTGTNGQTVNIIKNTSTLTGSNSGSLTLTPVGANSVVLTNSGAPGKDFPIGGSIDIAPTTIDGVYTGTVDVQVDYN
ncbi:DUF4402 domain-containing protein [Sphingomonas alba]|uniref:DUF4402 domain-containing protein n=1 Tax=Sphingomonas alba TaxID=2908208 RepID=A0ABT0RMQ9_9SPHN|nr:DUF4402 domain-containing protein [Sphingomonas alba]MCL6683848.1 DUF4402 domain-containing protein [Sphingomonas alba]